MPRRCQYGNGVAARCRYEGRDEERGDGRRVRRFLLVAPFSVAHLRRRAAGVWFSFSSLARLLSCRFSLIRACVARIVSVPRGVVVSVSSVGRYVVGGWRRDLASRLSSCSIRSVPAARSISLVSACGLTAVCAVFVSSFSSLASLVSVRLRSFPFVVRWRRGVSFFLAARPSSRLPVSWGVSCLFFAARLSSRLARQFAGGSLRCLVRQSVSRCSFRLSFLGVLSCPARLARSVFSSRPGVSSSSPYSRSARAVRLGGSYGGSCSPSRYFMFLSLVSISLVASHVHDGGGSFFSSRGGVFSFRCPVVGIGVRDDGDGMGVPFDDMRGRAVLFSSFSSIGAGAGGDMGMRR